MKQDQSNIINVLSKNVPKINCDCCTIAIMNVLYRCHIAWSEF